ncbi:MAG TPA: dihydrolipoamide succinyltransferase [Cytophagales bacterium]|nr:dihydrolipoamide succinyltransferase [Cytophagales bacterium]HAP61113.1 dihydrolipoamide succinyltransferase [Cytophagales bacterium]
MSLEIKVPTVGESVTEVTIGQWLKSDGDRVELDEVIAELESDKASFELPAEAAGILHIKVDEGDTIEIGGVIAEIEVDETAGTPAPAAPEEAPAAAAAPAPSGPTLTDEVIEMHVPNVGESITEVTIAEWFKETGEVVHQDEVIAEIESDKATFELPADATGKLEVIAEAGQTLDIGALLCKIQVMTGVDADGGAASGDSLAEPSAPSAAAPAGDATYATGHPSPAAGKILAEKGVNPASVQGTGRDGRITKEDAQRAQKPTPTPPAASKPASSAPAAEAPAPVGERNERRERMSNLRKTIARRLVSVKNETAMLTTFNEIDMKPMMDLRKKYKEQFKEKYEVGLGFMSFFTKAVAMAASEWPAVNGRIDEEAGEIIYHDYCDVSIAVSTPKGLVVPVIRNAEQLSFAGVEKEVIRLATRARDGKLTIDEMTGGTFTITNGGVFGSMLSTPIINAPQSAILGMHNIVQRPVAINGEVVIRPIMYVALSYDHRIVDGKESVSFLYRVKELIEDPGRLLLGV